MNTKFATEDPSEMGVCVHIPYGGFYHHRHHLHLSSVKIGNEGRRKRGRSGGTSNRYPQ